MTRKCSERLAHLAADEPIPASIVLGIRLRHIRERRGLSAHSFIERCTQLGVSGLPTNVLANTETGRRVTNVDELLVFALALDIPPVALLVPPRERPLTVAVTKRVVLTDRVALTGWLRGDEALPDSDRDHYATYVADLPVTAPAQHAALQATLGRVVTQFNAQIGDLADRMRSQVTDAFDEVAERAQDGATTEELLEALAEAGRRIGPPAPQ